MTSLLTARQVAEVIGVSTETVLRWHRRGELPAIRLPGGALRFHADTLDAWLAERATPGRGVSPAPASAAQRPSASPCWISSWPQRRAIVWKAGSS